MNNDQAQWLAKIPTRYQGNYQSAITSKSKAAAIKAKCLDCTCWQRMEITNCPVTACPLYPHRPYRTARKRKNPPVAGHLAEEIGQKV